MNFHPKVSIVIPVYNGTNYLKDAIEAALAQTYPNIEVIVVNDGSNDDGKTEALALTFGEKIRYFSKNNGGVSTALNLGISVMTGDYFSWLSHDDLYMPNKIEAQIGAFAEIENRRKIILYSNFSAQYVDFNNKIVEIRLENLDPKSFRYQVAVENKLHGCTLLIPKAAFIECGFFNEELRAIQDYDMWFRLGAKYTFVHLPQTLVIGRVHGEQDGVRMKGRAIQENICFRKKCLNELTSEEVFSATNKSKSLSFVSLVDVFFRRNLYPVAGHAFMLSAKSLMEDGFINALLWPFYLVKSLLKSLLFLGSHSLRKLASIVRIE